MDLSLNLSNPLTLHHALQRHVCPGVWREARVPADKRDVQVRILEDRQRLRDRSKQRSSGQLSATWMDGKGMGVHAANLGPSIGSYCHC